jgi:hypothetical protein
MTLGEGHEFGDLLRRTIEATRNPIISYRGQPFLSRLSGESPLLDTMWES